MACLSVLAACFLLAAVTPTGGIAGVAGGGECRPLSKGEKRGNYIVPGTRGGIVYRRVDGRDLALDALLQAGTGRRPGVIVVHGGGWRSGSRAAYIGQFLELLTEAGYHWFSIDYRLGGPERSAEAIDDLRAAIAFVRCHARELRLDPERIVLLGEDSGAAMVAAVASRPESGIRAAVLIGGIYDEESPNGVTGIDPVKMPATLVIHGTDDRESSPARAASFCERAQRAGQGCDYVGVEGASHRPENWWPSQWGYRERMRGWLAREVGQWPASVAEAGGGLRKNIVYKPELKLKLDAWIPPGPGPHPAVILAHGGGWEAGDKVTYLTPILRPLAEAGFAWFSIDYRLTPTVRHESQLEDLRDAIRFVAANARQFKVDKGRLALLGESASGQMVAQIATERLPEVAAVISFYGVYDFTAMASSLTARSIPTRLFGMTTLGGEERRRLERYSPLFQATSGMAPLLLICGTRDGLFAQHRRFSEKLRELGVNFKTIELPEAPHGMENWEGHPEWSSYQQQMIEWLVTHLRRRPATGARGGR